LKNLFQYRRCGPTRPEQATEDDDYYCSQRPDSCCETSLDYTGNWSSRKPLRRIGLLLSG
jgi:hypothetical protein